MEILTTYIEETPRWEITLDVVESQTLVEAVAGRVLSLIDQNRRDEISALDEDIIDCSPGFGIELTIEGSTYGLVKDLKELHNSPVEAVDGIMDARHVSRLKNKWKLDARSRLNVGRTALSMADTLGAIEAAHNLDTLESIDELRAFTGPCPDNDIAGSNIGTCGRDNSQTESLPVCYETMRRQRRTYHHHR